jgi:glycosyltransferase involved in cell wall biosynthesis
MKLSVLIACYNGEATLADQLDGLAGQEWSEPWEIIFADNRSTDSSRRIAEAYRQRLPNLRIVDASAKQGKAFALNKGIEAAEGESIAFADADDQVAPGWLAAIGEALKVHELVATSCDVETLNRHEHKSYRLSLQSEGLQPIHYPPHLPHAGGGTIGIRRALHMKIGGFDETLPFLEDTDYVWKAQLAGAKFHFVPDAVMRVRYRETLSGIYRQKRNYAEYNVFLSKRYRDYGEPMPHPWRGYFNGWKHLLRSVRKLRKPASRGDWVGQLGTLVGKTKGVIKYRVPPT